MQEMLYASRHEVLVEFLKGFILQSGGQDVLKSKLEADYGEPWYDWRKNNPEL